MASKVIYIAEDDELLRNLYERKFTLSGYTIQTAADGKAVLDLIAAKQPDLLILDINMPGFDGFQVLDSLAETERNYPILMLSNFADDPHKEKAATYKIDRFLEKQHTTIKHLLEIAEEMIGADK